MSKGTEKYDVFISYSRKDYVDDNKNVIDGNVVSRIKQAFDAAGISYWFDEEGINHGDEFAKEIVRNIRSARVFIFVSTKNSNASEWTSREIASAHMMKKRIIPVRVDDSPYNEDVMFYISILDFIDYKANPDKGVSDLVKSVKSYLEAEHEAEVQKQQKEEERRRKEERQQVRQKQMDELKTEIDRTESECTSLEQSVLSKQHDLEVVRAALRTKREQLDELRSRLSHLSYGDDELAGGSMPVVEVHHSNSVEQLEQTSWRQPWKKINLVFKVFGETLDTWHHITSFLFILAAVFCLIALPIEIFQSLDYIHDYKNFFFDYSILGGVITLGIGLYNIFRNKRVGVFIILAAPISAVITGLFHGEHDLLLYLGRSFIVIGLIVCSLFLRKNGKSAFVQQQAFKWRDLRVVGCVVAFLMIIACIYGISYSAREKSSQSMEQAKKTVVAIAWDRGGSDATARDVINEQFRKYRNNDEFVNDVCNELADRRFKRDSAAIQQVAKKICSQCNIYSPDKVTIARGTAAIAIREAGLDTSQRYVDEVCRVAEECIEKKQVDAAINYLDHASNWCKSNMEQYIILRGLYDALNEYDFEKILSYEEKLDRSTRFHTIVVAIKDLTMEQRRILEQSERYTSNSCISVDGYIYRQPQPYKNQPSHTKIRNR